ncbi:PAS domain-containing protein [Magnetospirillum sp. UT-4]|uniref:PAS domain-containing protein n=1 Tax=Magnetospirillum sp. UT-4 TaxID=2681467 RepID=UPI00137F6FC0|nr:PAS domain-containing protein [Magnetospirillum sp. UT-4]CAA7619699.1 PAS/PAC domain [Magnetospirillum sp. UT-4]
MAADLFLSGRVRTFARDEIIVSKTDRTGKITYANDVFIALSGYSEDELLGAPHSILRHPAMPRCVFRLLWDTIEKGDEIFAYVVNRAKNGDEYWVFAHVTPNFGPDGGIVGYHSNRRVPKDSAVETVKPLYAELLAMEQAAPDRKVGVERSYAALLAKVGELGFASYDQLIFAICR